MRVERNSGATLVLQTILEEYNEHLVLITAQISWPQRFFCLFIALCCFTFVSVFVTDKSIVT